MKLNIRDIIFLALIGLFVWLWLTKSTEVIDSSTIDEELLEQLTISHNKIIRSDTIIDSLTLVITKGQERQMLTELALKNLSKAYEKQVESISDNSVLDDIRLFSAEYAKSISN